MPPPLLIGALLALPGHLGYVAVGLLIGIESMGVPVPGETALIAASVLAGNGELDIVTVILAASAGAIVGDNVGYLIGRKGGRRLLERPGRMADQRRRLLEGGERFFARHGAKAVFLGRWFTGLRITAAWLAGINRMPWRTFLFWNATGGIAWAATVGVVAYLLGDTAERLIRTVGVVGGVAVIAALIGTYLYLRLRRRRAAAAATTAIRPESP